MKKYAIVVRKSEDSFKIAEDIKKQLNSFMDYDEINPEVVISVGGDGTVLESVHRYRDKNPIFVPLHTGTLGFFTAFQKNEIDLMVKALRCEILQYDERTLLEVKIYSDDVKTFYCLNEMRIDHGFSTQVITVYINNELLETFRGNGLCVSTDSGSTGYNKSLGGAVIYPGTNMMQLTEVAGIHHNAYRSLNSPLVLSDKEVIKLEGNNFKHLYVGMDNKSYQFDNVRYVEAKMSNQKVKILANHQTFIDRIRKAYISE
ncbi:MAG: NAD kinase [Thomasclavelia sp.]|jgi:NAD+ kinase|nr:NAD kinase [Thomasclavelia sp.]